MQRARDITRTQHDTARLIDALVGAATPTRPAASGWQAAGIWLLLSGSSTALLVTLLGPLSLARGDASALSGLVWQLALGLLALSVATIIGLERDGPGAASARLRVALVSGIGALWIASLLLPHTALGVFGLETPSARLFDLPGPDLSAAALLGKRTHCFVEGLGIAAPPAMLALGFLDRRTLHASAGTGAWLGAAAGSWSALAMQIACVDAPTHVLSLHLPILPLAAAACAIAARFVLPRG